jgi:hypothetical protein
LPWLVVTNLKRITGRNAAAPWRRQSVANPRGWMSGFEALTQGRVESQKKTPVIPCNASRLSRLHHCWPTIQNPLPSVEQLTTSISYQ